MAKPKKKPAQQALKANYEAVATNRKRKLNVVNLRNEDTLLKQVDRDKLISEARILKRNSPTVGWMIRTHLNHVATHHFKANTRRTYADGTSFDDVLAKAIKRYSQPDKFDVAGRVDLQTGVRLAESGRIVAGDHFWMALSDGTIQRIEADRVRTPSNFGEWTLSGSVLSNPYDSEAIDLKNVVNGVEYSRVGRALRYLICERDENSFVLKYVIPARHVYQHVVFDRDDQGRGVSELASAINTFCDLHEATGYALGKMKLSQIFGLKLQLDGTDDSDDDSPRQIDIASGPSSVELGIGENAEIIESKNPSNEFQAFLQKGIQAGLKALNIPYVLYDEGYTNYSGQRQAIQNYRLSCATDRRAVQSMLMWWTRWRLGLAVLDGELVLPEGWTVDDVMEHIQWTPIAIQWPDPKKESDAQATRIEKKLASRQAICAENGEDWFEITDQLAEEEEYMRSKGMTAEQVKGQTSDGQSAGMDAVIDRLEELAERIEELAKGDE